MRSGSIGSRVISASLRRFRPGRHATSKRAGSRGFTLIESLTALTILVIALVALLNSYSDSLRAVQTSSSYTAATILAQSLLAQSLLDNAHASSALAQTSKRGRTGKLSWSVATKLVDTLRSAKGTDRALMYRIQVRVRGPKSRSLVLETLRLVDAQ